MVLKQTLGTRPSIPLPEIVPGGGDKILHVLGEEGVFWVAEEEVPKIVAPSHPEPGPLRAAVRGLRGHQRFREKSHRPADDG